MATTPHSTTRAPSLASPAPLNALAVIGFVLAFVFCPAGLVVSLIALRSTSRTGERGKGLAIAGTVVSLVFIAIGVTAGFMVGWQLQV